MRLSVLAIMLSLVGVGLCNAQSARASIRHETHIPPEGLNIALQVFAKDFDLQVLYHTDVVRGLTTQGASGSLTCDEALGKVLLGTGLSYQYLDADTVTVFAQGSPPEAEAVGSWRSSNSSQQGGGKPSSQEFRVAQVDQGNAKAPLAPSAATSDSASPVLEEVTVTAQKREERLQDVPVPVTAISGAALVETNLLRLQDYYATVPGFSVAPGPQSQQVLSIRGVTTGTYTNPTVGVTIDDVPYGASTGAAVGNQVPDIDPGDLARIEVLRGPQGTLYGASSMGGLLKFVTVDPSTDRLSGRLEVGTNSVHNGAELGYSARGSVNVPLSDTFAIRASAFTHQDPGYIDNPVLGIDGVNEQRVSGGRIAGLLRPAENVSLKLSALYQHARADGSSMVEPPTAAYPQTTGLGDLQQNDLRGTGGFDRKVQAYSANLSAKLGSVDLAVLSGYNINNYSDSVDYTWAVGGLAQFGVPGTGFNGFGVSGSPVVDKNLDNNKFTQEIRFSSSFGNRLEWLLGGYYTHEDYKFAQDILAVDPTSLAVRGIGLSGSARTTFAEYAAFGDLTFHFGDRFDVQVGGRESKIKQSVEQSEVGPYAPLFFLSPSPIIYPLVRSENNAFTYLFTPRFRINPDVMVYARLASGYRAGGPNLGQGAGTPAKYNPDKTKSYEFGAKGSFLDNKLTIDSSVYYIDWTDIQLKLLNPRTSFTYDANGGTAKSQGAELSVQTRPITGLTLAGWVTLTDAVLTEALPASSTVAGASGDRLPYSSRFSGNLSAQQDFPISGDLSGFVGATVIYVGDRKGEFVGAAVQRQELPAYTQTDLRAGLKYTSWTTNLYVTNISDKRGLISGGQGAVPPFGFYYIQPRTIGLSVIRGF